MIKTMPFETYQELPQATNEELMDFLDEQINIVLIKAKMNNRIFRACFNEILKEINKRLDRQ